MTNDPWDDERLTAAFDARAAEHPTPASLTSVTVEAVRADRRQPRWSLSLVGRPWVSVATALVVVLVVVAIVGPWRGSSVIVGPSSPASGDTSPSTSADASAAPTGIDALPIISVIDAQRVRDGGVDDRELRVRGWVPAWSSLPTTSCAESPESPPSPLESVCGPAGSAMYQEPAGIPGSSAPPLGDRNTASATVQLYVDGVDISWWLTAGPSNHDPIELDVVGHFDDRRATSCDPDASVACHDLFVVDQVVSAGGKAVSVVRSQPDPFVAPDDMTSAVSTVLGTVAPDETVLSILAVFRERLGSIEPALAGWDGLPTESTIWRVQMLKGETAKTYLIGPAAFAAYLVADDGTASLVSLPFDGPLPTVVFGLPVISVDAARDIRDTTTGDKEIAVRGWLGSVTVPCPTEPGGPGAPFGLSCEDQFRWLMSAPGQPDTNGPAGPSIQPVFESGVATVPEGRVVILIGHFNDRREPGAPWFIVDASVTDGLAPATAPSVIHLAPVTQSTDAEVAALAAAASPSGHILWMVAYPPGELLTHEPSLGGLGIDGLVAWRIGSLEGDRLVTYLVQDGTTDVYRMQPDGSVTPMSIGPQRSPDPTPAPSTALHDGQLEVREIIGGEGPARPGVPAGYGPASWTLDPAYPKPTATTRTLHLLVTEVACSSGQPADDRLSPAYVVVAPTEIIIAIGVRPREGGQDCQANQVTPVAITLSTPIGDRALLGVMTLDGTPESPG